MQIYYVRGRDHLSQPFSAVVQAINEATARELVRRELEKVPILFWCEAVGDAFRGETEQRIVLDWWETPAPSPS